MNKWKEVIWQKKNVKWLLLLEVLIVAIYGLIIVISYSGQELVFDENDMQLKRLSAVEEGNYFDTTFEDMSGVVTPAFQVPKGVYYIEASYTGRGIVKAGLIYEEPRDQKELVDDYEFILNPEKQVMSYRVRVHDDSKLRFRLRLTGDAVDGDYIQLCQVRIVPSRMGCLYYIFWPVFFFLFANLILWGYVRYYARWEPERKAVFGVLTFTAFFTGLPFFQRGLDWGPDLTFHLSRFEGIYRGLGFGVRGGGNTISC